MAVRFNMGQDDDECRRWPGIGPPRGLGTTSREEIKEAWLFADPLIRHEFRAKPDDPRMITVDGDSWSRWSRAATGSWSM